jgi:hypothetical protein
VQGTGKEASQVVIKAVLVAYGNLATVGGVGMYKELINTQGMLEGNKILKSPLYGDFCSVNIRGW